MQEQKVHYSPKAHHIHATEVAVLIAVSSACWRARDFQRCSTKSVRGGMVCHSFCFTARFNQRITKRTQLTCVVVMKVCSEVEI